MVASAHFREWHMGGLPFGRRVQDKLIQVARRQRGRLVRMVRAPELPRRDDGRRLLHLGCGDVNAPGWINVDLVAAPHIHVITTLDDLGVITSGTIDLVYASHCLEHFSHHHTGAVLKEWARVLKPGGTLRIAVPDFAVLVRAYATGRKLEELEGYLYGGQDVPLNLHKVALDEGLLTQRMHEAGIGSVRRWDPAAVADHGFGDASREMITVDGERIPVSLRLEGTRQ